MTTDFGTSDWFVGTMEGVILGIHPRASVVNITHEIPPGDIRAGAFALMASCRYFLKGTVHVAVVDPGVGSRRRAVAVRTANGVFIGPDNGVLSWALRREKIISIRLLENRKFFLEPVSRTFHGRDIFASVAAHLSRGLSVERLGRELKDLRRLPWPRPTKHGTNLQGQIVHIDRFGNAITNLEGELLPGKVTGFCEVKGKRKVRCALAECYSAVSPNQPLGVIGSCGLLEIAVNGGSAARKFGLKIGDLVITPQKANASEPAHS
ncbi:MAG TPA: SAM-dependent chlorinase/fluorinase [Candidatus Acidoferrales bacterium]|nr:SAM-dependent chlorinase/fluorinase [Candidatus Acidoferrales bacterium]